MRAEPERPSSGPCPAPASASSGTTASTRSPSPRQDGGQGKRRARLLVLAKSSILSTVYRPSYLDYVAVRRFSQETGEVIGEYRFLGLYTQAAYTESVTRIPVLRRKLDRVLDTAGRARGQPRRQGAHRDPRGLPARRAVRDQRGAARPDRPGGARPRRAQAGPPLPAPDPYGRYVSCLVYLPRDRYTTQVRLRAQEILRSAFGGASVDYSAMVGNSALARLHVVVHAAPGPPARRGRPGRAPGAGSPPRSAPGTRTWPRRRSASSARSAPPTLLRTCADGIPETYKADTAPAPAVADLAVVRRLREERRAVRDPSFESGHGGAARQRRRPTLLAAARLPALPAHAVGRAAAVAAHGA